MSLFARVSPPGEGDLCIQGPQGVGVGDDGKNNALLSILQTHLHYKVSLIVVQLQSRVVVDKHGVPQTRLRVV